jgi:hypothetical protein
VNAFLLQVEQFPKGSPCGTLATCFRMIFRQS